MTNPTLPVVITEATLDFVLIGPHDGEQKLLARSKNLDLLLLGVARVPAHLTIPHQETPALWSISQMPQSTVQHSKRIAGLYDNDPEATLYSVTVLANVTNQEDAREEPFTFAWIGRSPEADLEPIREYFSNCVIPLHQAIFGDAPQEQLRWQLAPLLFLCARWTKTRRGTKGTVPSEAFRRARLRKLKEQEQTYRKQWIERLLALFGALISAGIGALLYYVFKH